MTDKVPQDIGEGVREPDGAHRSVLWRAHREPPANVRPKPDVRVSAPGRMFRKVRSACGFELSPKADERDD